MERLSGDPHAPANPESDAALKRFARWKGHPAVARLARMRAKGFAWDAPAQYAVYLTTPPVVGEAVPAPGFFAALAGGRDQLDAWRAELTDFVRVSDFMRWEREREPRREAELAAVRAAAAGRDLEPALTKYLGARPWSSWTVVVSPFFPNGSGASWVLEETPGKPEVIVVNGLYWQKGFWGRAAMSGGTPEKFAQGAWPEAVFAMTYALYEICRPVLKLAPDACAGLTGLVNAEDCVQQTWVRGVVARLMESEYGAEAAKAYREHWAPTPRQAAVDAALRAYEADRAANPDLLSAAGALLAPFQADGRAPSCRLVEKARFPETVYSRRLAYYLDARLAARPDAELEKARAELAAYRAGGKK